MKKVSTQDVYDALEAGEIILDTYSWCGKQRFDVGISDWSRFMGPVKEEVQLADGTILKRIETGIVPSSCASILCSVQIYEVQETNKK